MADTTTARAEADQPEKSPSPPLPQSGHRSRSGSGGRQTPPQQDFEAENVVEADTEDDGASSRAGDEVWDEGFDGSSIGNHSASTSLSNSVRDYVFENTRRYHKYMEGRYLMPNDEPEQEREDMKHAMCVNVMDGKLHCAPLENPQKIIDIGTGTGIWAIDNDILECPNELEQVLTPSQVGDEYPEADISGIDLSPIQPTWVPPNVRFVVDDAEAEWVWPPYSLDFVHARHMCMAVKNWPRMLSQAFTALKPGGWVELQELRFVLQCDDGTMPGPEEYGYGKFVDLCMSGFRSFGINPLAMERNSEMLRESGFENVVEKVWKVPIGTWPRDQKLKTIGLYNRSMLIDALQAVSMAPLTRGLKWSPAEVEVFLIDVRKSLMNVSIHSYLTFHVVFGQKPYDSY
ncbi:methyltransferase domain-containing protein [Colletotrichum paranaense]|uniref:Methyltransferase domain-containing protein n=1 Tax=Colletotrichum paranaense TaxID=1914294 RepID=A0ABQ9T3I6_9PEZI|nr:methyltransferase domain-containing protein [Colletotrichum paranaense]KAK1546343.1 methyltransferase domain-containing protein [Colletotrichum paranaense]